MVAHLKEPQTEQDATSRLRRRPPVRRIAIWGPLLLVLALAMALTAGIWRHVQQEHSQQSFAEQTGKTSVDVVNVKRDTKPHELMLPGNITAILETPELDQQLAAARSTQNQNEANFELARITAQRWQELLQKQVVSKQDNDQTQGNYQATAASLANSKANVAQLEDLQNFKNVIAPFDGTITTRQIDIGSLVSQGSGTVGTALFALAETDPVRIFIDVPQAEAPLIRVGMDAKIFVPERANRDFTGKVTRTSGALDPTARTLHVQVDIPNHDGALFVGMYAQVKFTLVDTSAPIVIPADAFVFRPQGSQVAGVTKDNKIHWQNINVGRDFGTYMEVLTGLEENARVVMNPSDDLTEGLPVDIKAPPAKQPAESPEKPK